MITFCGGEGAGKSTQARDLYRFFVSKNIDAVLTKEPGGTKTGMKIRKILLSPESEGLDPKAELFLYLADRAEHYKKLILPALEQGKIVICDRFIDSTYVYQGVARGLDKDFIDTAHKYIFQGFIPCLTVILDISYEKGCVRIENDQKSGVREEAESRFDNEKKSFHKLVRQGFLDLAANDDTGRFFVVDADNSQEEIFGRIKNKLIKEKIIDIKNE
ncbi:MAG: dTMP kinase [Thermodesulfobacteriota bacterium]